MFAARIAFTLINKDRCSSSVLGNNDLSTCHSNRNRRVPSNDDTGRVVANRLDFLAHQRFLLIVSRITPSIKLAPSKIEITDDVCAIVLEHGSHAGQILQRYILMYNDTTLTNEQRLLVTFFFGFFHYPFFSHLIHRKKKRTLDIWFDVTNHLDRVIDSRCVTHYDNLTFIPFSLVFFSSLDVQSRNRIPRARVLDEVGVTSFS